MAAIVIAIIAVLSLNELDAAGDKSQKYCDNLYSQTFSLDNPVMLIEKFPFMAAIGYIDIIDNNISYKCSGILINEQHVLTAAHCLNLNSAKPFHVKLGITNLNLPNNEDIQTINITKTTKHPNFTHSSKYNDIAIIKLEHPIDVSRHIKPVCLETKKISFYPFMVTASLGILAINETAPRQKLKGFNVIEYSNAECRKHFPNSKRIEKGIDGDLMICAGNRQEDPCVESGNPLMVINPIYGYKVVGVATFGKQCGLVDVPSVFFRVSNYIEWIESVAWP